MRWLISVAIVMFGCTQCSPIGPPGGGRGRPSSESRRPFQGAPSYDGGRSCGAMLRHVNMKVDMVKKGSQGRKVVRPMVPRYITIHSTQNYSAGAKQHSIALKNGALRSAKRPHGNRIGFMIWHYTVDQGVVIQHMPTNEQGEHADFDGPGNRLSIGIEMCENRGCNLAATVDRTAKLTAVLMKRNNIPLKNVVPHYHWPRRGKRPPNKNCPHFLLENGRPGAKWQTFQRRVNYYYQHLDH